MEADDPKPRDRMPARPEWTPTFSAGSIGAEPGPSRDDEERRETLDLRGLKCPMPVLRTRRALARMAAGAMLDVRCTDPLAGLDIPNLLRNTGDVLLVSTHRDGETCFRIRKAGPVASRTVPAAEDPSASAGVDGT